MVTLPLTLLSSLHTRCVSHQPALHKVATVSLHHVHGGSTRAQVHSQHLSTRQPLSHYTMSTEAQHVHKYTVNTSVQRVRHHFHQLSPAGSKEPPQNNHRVHAAHGTIYPVMRLYPLYFLSRVCIPQSNICIPCHASIHSLPRICITGHASAFPVTRLSSLSCVCIPMPSICIPLSHVCVPLVVTVTRLYTPSCHCHTSVLP